MRTADEVMYILWKRRKWTQKQIADLFGCDIATVCRRVEPERWKHWEVVISPQKLKGVYEELQSIQKVADSLLCGKETVRRKLHMYNIRVAPRGRQKSESNLF
jgi:hypothetical protein